MISRLFQLSVVFDFTWNLNFYQILRRLFYWIVCTFISVNRDSNVLFVTACVSVSVCVWGIGVCGGGGGGWIVFPPHVSPAAVSLAHVSPDVDFVLMFPLTLTVHR